MAVVWLARPRVNIQHVLSRSHMRACVRELRACEACETTRSPAVSVYRSGGSDPWRRTDTAILLLAAVLMMHFSHFSPRGDCNIRYLVTGTVQQHARTVVVQMHPEDRCDGSMRSSYKIERQYYWEASATKGAFSVLQSGEWTAKAIVPWRTKARYAISAREGRSFPPSPHTHRLVASRRGIRWRVKWSRAMARLRAAGHPRAADMRFAKQEGVRRRFVYWRGRKMTLVRFSLARHKVDDQPSSCTSSGRYVHPHIRREKQSFPVQEAACKYTSHHLRHLTPSVRIFTIYITSFTAST